MKDKIYDDELITNLVSYIADGNYVRTACMAAGLSTTAFYRWMATGKEVEARVESRPDADDVRVMMARGETVDCATDLEARCWLVRAQVIRASARAEIYAAALVRKAMPDDWLAAMTYLERRFPERWRRRSTVGVEETQELPATGIDEAALMADPEAMSLIHEALARVSTGVRAELRKPVKRELLPVEASEAD